MADPGPSHAASTDQENAACNHQVPRRDMIGIDDLASPFPKDSFAFLENPRAESAGGSVPTRLDQPGGLVLGFQCLETRHVIPVTDPRGIEPVGSDATCNRRPHECTHQDGAQKTRAGRSKSADTQSGEDRQSCGADAKEQWHEVFHHVG